MNDQLAQQHSDRLKQQIVAHIKMQQGWLSFADYMHDCLYYPGLGYYSGGSHKLGQSGDFTTAAELSPLFGQALGNHFLDVARQFSRFDMLEFGAGSGKLAVAILQQLDRLNALPDCYYILETSADLKQRQQIFIKQHLPTMADKFVWLNSIPSDFCGVILANEVCDAMPVHLLKFSEDDVAEQGVSMGPEGLVWQTKPINEPRLISTAHQIREQIGRQRYLTEVNLLACDWLESVGKSLSQGGIFIIDYGYSFSEYYRPERNNGTLRCYYRHQAHENPLLLPGLQDITAHINFTSLAEKAQAAGLDVAGFHEQSDFLLAGDITKLAAELERQIDSFNWLKHSNTLKQLLMPGAMGHQFKVLSLTRGINLLPRLQAQDRRYQL